MKLSRKIYWKFQRSWIKKLIDMTPLPAYHIFMNGESGYVSFRMQSIIDERAISAECGNDDVFTYKRIWISPRELDKRGEFTGW